MSNHDRRVSITIPGPSPAVLVLLSKLILIRLIVLVKRIVCARPQTQNNRFCKTANMLRGYLPVVHDPAQGFPQRHHLPTWFRSRRLLTPSLILATLGMFGRALALAPQHLWQHSHTKRAQSKERFYASLEEPGALLCI